MGGIEISKSPKGTGYRLLSHHKPVEQLDLDAGQRLFLSFEASLFLSEWNYIDMYVHVHIQLYDPAHSILGEFSSLRATESCFWFWLSYFISRSNSEIAFFLPIFMVAWNWFAARCVGRDSLWACCICFSRNRFKGFHKLEQRRA